MTVAVVVPVYNAASVLPWSVPAILAQSGVSQWVFVDDGSTDDSATRLEALIGSHPSASVRRIRDNRGRAHARNRGIEAVAEADVAVFLDADVAPPPGTVEAFVRALSHTEAVAAVAPIHHLDPPDDLYGAYVRRGTRGLGATEGGTSVPWRYFVTAACAVTLEALREAGGFDERIRYGEDLALAVRLDAAYGSNALRSIATPVPMRDTSTLDRALADVQQFGRELRRLAREHPNALRVAGLPRWFPRAARWYPRPLGRIAASVGRRLGAHLPEPMQASVARWMLGEALIQSFAASRSTHTVSNAG